MIKKKVAVFKPYNARCNNAFYSGEYHMYKVMHESNKYEITFFLDDKNVKFNGVINKYIKVNSF